MSTDEGEKPRDKRRTNGELAWATWRRLLRRAAAGKLEPMAMLEVLKELRVSSDHFRDLLTDRGLGPGDRSFFQQLRLITDEARNVVQLWAKWKEAMRSAMPADLWDAVDALAAVVGQAGG